MKRMVIFLLLFVCIFGLFGLRSEAIEYADFKRQLKEILVPRGDEFTDDELTYLVVMGRIAAMTHGLSKFNCGTTEDTLLDLYPGQQHYKMPLRPGGNSLDVFFPTGISRVTGGKYIPIAQAKLEDYGHLPTQSVLSYYAFYRDGMTTYVFLWPPQPAKYETLQICYYKCGFSSTTIDEDANFFTAWLNYSLFLAYIALEDWVNAADSYNAYRSEITALREEVINTQPDITVAPQTIK